MAGELCTRGCGYCGRCDAAYADDRLDESAAIVEDAVPTCEHCGSPDCQGDCELAFEAMHDEMWEAEYEDVAARG